MKYDKYLKETSKLYIETGLRSDSLALLMHEKYKEINPSNFGRWIRENKILQFIDSSKKTKSKPKILLLDVETAPILGFYWSFWNNPMQEMVVKRPHMISWSAKWLFDNTIMSDCLTAKEIDDRNEKRLLKGIWNLINEADILIAHNGKKFDFKVLNTRFIENGMKKPSSYQFIDTLLHTRKQFKFESNRLDYIAKNILQIDGKMETPKGLWFDVINSPYLRNGGTKEKQKESLKIMEQYNREDVKVLEDVYLLLRPYIYPHPNLGLLIDDGYEVCPSCGSKNYETISEYMTYVNIFPECRCHDCKSLFRMRKNSTPEHIKNRLTVSTPR